MENSFANLISELGFQLPLLVVYIAGIFMAINRRAEAPTMATHTLIALLILLLDAVILSHFNRWFANNLMTQSSDYQSATFTLSLLGLGRNLVHAVAFAILLKGIFPGAGQAVMNTPWLRYTAGGILGLLLGACVALVLATAIVEVFQVSNFEGQAGYFVAFLVVPLFALVGAIVGLLIVYMFRRSA